jgi:hypothetical protein
MIATKVRLLRRCLAGGEGSDAELCLKGKNILAKEAQRRGQAA